MKKAQIPSTLAFKLIAILLLFNFIGNAQTMKLEIIGGAEVTQGSTVTINAGTSVDFRITNVDFSNCGKLKIQDVDISNTADFDITPNNPKRNIKPYGCRGGKKYLDFEVQNMSFSCSTASTLITVEIKNQADFTFTLEVNSSPEIYVLGGTPFRDINHGDVTTSAENGTYFGIVDEGASVTRTYAIANIGNCPLDINAITSSNPDFVVSSPFIIPWLGLDPYYYIVFDVTFTANAPLTAGTNTSVISIDNTDNTTFTFTVSSEIFNFTIPGPGGVVSDFRLWLKTTRGITETSSKVSLWEDYGTNGKNAEQPTGANQPTFLDTAADNINYNPVIKFENDGAGVEQYMYNTTNGFYSHDIFIVMIPDATMTSASTRNTIFAGVSSGNAGDITGIGFGDYSTRFTNETLSYNQDVPTPTGTYNGEAEINSTYSNAGIINVRNNAFASPTGQDILYNSAVLATSSTNDVAYANVGTAGPPVLGTEYWIGKNFDIQGSLNGRVAEIFTFAERVTDAERHKIESYLAIKYGITLGASNEAQKDYKNSFDTNIWDISANTGFNYDIAGIGRDSISDLNQKQSKSLNLVNDVTIGLGSIYETNSANPSEFKKNGDFLVWGSNNATYTSGLSNTLTLSPYLITTVTRINREWKIVETSEDVNGDVENVFVSIPSAAFSGFALGADEEYVLIVSDTENFLNADIIDVIPLKSDGGSNLQTWYDFDGTKYFTFGKASNVINDSSVSIGAGDYLVGEYSLNLNVDYFTISAWVKTASTAGTRTIMSKGEKLQLRLNDSEQVEVMIDDSVTPKFTSTIALNDGKWHQVTFVYDSGTIYLYIDGILDKSQQNVTHPSPNYNRFSVGAVYIDKNNIINPFMGEIDEVYVWDVGLSHDQVKYLMNQEVERFDNAGTDYVSGKTMPYSSSSNEIDAITWSHLRAYYDFNSFYGSTIEGLTDERNFLRLKYLDKDKSLVDEQTIPAPYVSIADGVWGDISTWSGNSFYNPPNSVGIDGTTVIDWNVVETNHNITSGDRDITVLGLKNNSGTLTIADPVDAQDETNSGQALTVTHYLELDGVIDLVGESQLIQEDGSILDEDSGGYLERDQQGTSNGFNYNYWSSSVGPISGNSATRGTGVASTNANSSANGVLFDGTNSAAYQNITFNSSHTAADSNTPTTPRTISTYWMYKFYGPADNYASWASINETSALLPGEGFTMKGTSGATDLATGFQNYVFKGKPNNGDITLPLNKNVTAQNPSGNVERLVGNPYPSAIDATEFILDNLSVADGGTNTNGTIINGAVYFWDHFGEENTHLLREYVGGYATRNLTGGVAAISNDSRINSTSNAGGPATGTKIPGQYIPVNQGFFVSTAIEGFNNDDGVPISSVDGGNVVFKNSQRVFVTEEVAASSVFMRTSGNTKIKPDANQEPINELPKVRLLYQSPGGYYRQIMLGSNIDASMDFDFGYDAFISDLNEEDMYWIIEDGKFVIQGVNKFLLSQEFPLGLAVENAGFIKITAEELVNLDPGLVPYIRDNVTGRAHNIKTSPFEISLEPGVYNDRFSMVFQTSKTLGDDTAELDNSLILYYDKDTFEINIKKLTSFDVFDVTVYNLIGQEIKTVNLLPNKNTIPLRVNSGVYVLKFNTSKGVISKKIIID